MSTMKKLLEAMTKFAGEPEQKPGDQVKATDVAKASKGSKHPFLNQLVGDSKEIEKKRADNALEESLTEQWANFDEDADSESLSIGDDVIITGAVTEKGKTGVVTELGRDGRFVVVNLYNGGQHSFHSSDVSFNEYADSDAEEAEMYDKEGNDWSDDVDEARGRNPDDEYDERRQEKLDDATGRDQAKRPQTKVYTLTGRGPNMEPNYKFPGEYASQADAVAARTKLMANPKTPNPTMISIDQRTRYLDIKESIESTDPLESALLSAIQELISQGHVDVDPTVLTNMVVAATSQPFLLKDLVDANNNSQAVQHFIDSISPSKVKFSSDMLTVKNEDPAKEVAKSQAGVMKMAIRAGGRNRLGEGALNEDKKVDMMGKTCSKCKKGKYAERSQNDDTDGKVTCTCGNRVDRWKKEKTVTEASDISGLMAASHLNKQFRIKTDTKTYKVKAQSANVAKEILTKKFPDCKILSVTDITDLDEMTLAGYANSVKFAKGDRVSHGALGNGTVAKQENDNVYMIADSDRRLYRLTPGSVKSLGKSASRLFALKERYTELSTKLREFKESRGQAAIASKLDNMDNMRNVQVPTPEERREQIRIRKAKEAGKKQVKEFVAPGVATADAPATPAPATPATPASTATPATPATPAAGGLTTDELSAVAKNPTLATQVKTMAAQSLKVK
jgi:hypothetical protein